MSEKKNLKKYWWIGLAGLLLVGVVTFIVRQIVANNQSAKAGSVTTHSAASPDESKTAAASYSWQGTADEPKKIRIQRLGINAYIQKLGVDQHTQIATPSNVHLAGWYNGSVKPGHRGLSIIVGHVSGIKGDGIFKYLDRLVAGDQFAIELGNGTIKSYKILGSKRVAETKAAAYLFSQEPNISHQLNLITCAGNFDARTQQYPDRLIVTAVQL